MVSTLSEERPETSRNLKKAQNRSKPSVSEPRKQGAEEISPQKENTSKEFKPSRPGKSGFKSGASRPAVSYTNSVKSIRLVLVPKSFPEQIPTHEEKEDLIVMEMCEGRNKNLIFTAIRFRPAIILIDCATEDTVD